MVKKIINFFIIIIFFQANQSFASDGIKPGNDGQSSIIPKTSVAKPPLKLTSFKSAEKRIIKAKKYDKKGKKKKALKLYEEALDYLYEANKIEPLEPRILNYLGLANKKIGKLDDAEIYLIMGLEIEPENNEMNKNLGILYVATNRIDEANERLNILNKCNCQEYSELNSIIKNSK